MKHAHRSYIFLPVTILLLCLQTCTAQNTHTSDLTWNASPSGGVSSYNVYQSTTPGAEVIAKTGILASSCVAGVCKFTVPGLAPLTKYFWTVTAVCLVCVPPESVFSNEASGTTKADGQPSPASGLAAATN
jgi:hypothetical protein